jgi:enediyne biosynthesis protein E4
MTLRVLLHRSAGGAAALAVTVVLLGGVGNAGQAPAAGVRYRDITRAAGITFTHYTGATGKKYLPETLGPGVAFIDYNGDGRQDLYFTNGRDWPGSRRRVATPNLFRNNGDGTFANVTRTAGLATELYGMGAAVGDYDNDGDDDLFVTAVGQNRLFRNTRGVFADVTALAGLAGPHEFSTSTAWLDYDRDGHLDLVVANYVQWSPESDIFCSMDGTRKSYCSPESYPGASLRLWRNTGKGTFEDRTEAARLSDRNSKGLGVAILDLNDDFYPDILLANDTQPNRLYLNSGKGTFTDVGVRSGVAFSEDGIARAGMGVDAADYDRSGHESIVLTNFSNQMIALYHNEGNGLFVDEAPRSEVGRRSLLTLGFGCFFFDHDLDGWLDLLVANGHLDADIERVQQKVRYAQPAHLFRNVGKGQFREVTDAAGADLARPRVARGAAHGDLDGDGDLDIVITTNGGGAAVLRADGGPNKSLRLRLVGTRSNRNGFGARVLVTSGPDVQTRLARSGSSYLSQSETVLTFGLGVRDRADRVEVRWPSGRVDIVTGLAAGVVHTLREGGA